MRLLVVDDDKDLCTLLDEFLRREGLEADFANNGESGLGRFRRGGIDLVVLDVMLPGLDGFEVLRSIRKASNIPVIMLTARGEDIDRIIGLELGADDYLPKPFNPRELIARIRAVLRRLHPFDHDPARLEIGDVVLDSGSHEVECGGRRVELTTLEFEILEMMMRAAGRIITRDQIMQRLYDHAAGPFDRSIDMHVSHLRRKLGTAGNRIKTVRGSGYRFVRGT
jgi:two-component system, OmpR family, response regulator CpxR